MRLLIKTFKIAFKLSSFFYRTSYNGILHIVNIPHKITIKSVKQLDP